MEKEEVKILMWYKEDDRIANIKSIYNALKDIMNIEYFSSNNTNHRLVKISKYEKGIDELLENCIKTPDLLVGLCDKTKSYEAMCFNYSEYMMMMINSVTDNGATKYVEKALEMYEKLIASERVVFGVCNKQVSKLYKYYRFHPYEVNDKYVQFVVWGTYLGKGLTERYSEKLRLITKLANVKSTEYGTSITMKKDVYTCSLPYTLIRGLLIYAILNIGISRTEKLIKNEETTNVSDNTLIDLQKLNKEEVLKKTGEFIENNKIILAMDSEWIKEVGCQELPENIIAMAEEIDVEEYINSNFEDNYLEEVEDEDGSVDEHMTATTSIILDNYTESEVFIADADEQCPWLIIASYFMGDWNSCPAIEVMLAVAKRWYDTYKALPVVISQSEIEFSIPDITIEQAEQIAKEVVAFAPDSIYQNLGTIKAYAYDILKRNSIYIWWD